MQKVRLPIRTDGMTLLSAGCEPAVKDRGTGELAVDPRTGQTVYRVHVTVIRGGERRPELWSVSVVGEPKGVDVGVPLRFTNLEASNWEMENNRHGISFRADEVAPLNGPTSSNGSTGSRNKETAA